MMPKIRRKLSVGVAALYPHIGLVVKGSYHPWTERVLDSAATTYPYQSLFLHTA